MTVVMTAMMIKTSTLPAAAAVATMLLELLLAAWDRPMTDVVPDTRFRSAAVVGPELGMGVELVVEAVAAGRVVAGVATGSWHSVSGRA